MTNQQTARKRQLDAELRNRKAYRRLHASKNNFDPEYCSGWVKKFSAEEVAEYEEKYNPSVNKL